MKTIIGRGIDVSKYQGTIDWKKVKKAGVQFVIIRAGYGKLSSQVDSKFVENYNNAKANGIKVGLYWYSYATTPAEAKQEAAACKAVIGNRAFDYPIYYDVEEGKTLNTGKSNVSAIIKAFCSEMEASGYYVGVYMSKAAAEAYLTDEVKNRYAMWIAHWGVKETTYKGNYGLWQSSSIGVVPGINGVVDTDVSYIDYPEIIVKRGYNNNHKVSTKPATKPTKPATKPTKPATKPIKPVAPAKKTIEITVKIDGKSYKGKLTEV